MASLYLKNKAEETWGTERVSSGSSFEEVELGLVDGLDIRGSFLLIVRFTAANFLVFLAFPIVAVTYCICGVWS